MNHTVPRGNERRNTPLWKLKKSVLYSALLHLGWEYGSTLIIERIHILVISIPHPRIHLELLKQLVFTSLGTLSQSARNSDFSGFSDNEP